MQTKNKHLQQQLENWAVMISQAAESSNKAEDLRRFAETFVPADVTPEDIDHFTSNLFNDEVRDC